MSAYSKAGYSGSIGDVEHMVRFGIGRGVTPVSEKQMVFDKTVDVINGDRAGEIYREVQGRRDGGKNVVVLVKDIGEFYDLMKSFKGR